MVWGAQPFGARRLLALFNGLSPRSATGRAKNSKGVDWSMQEELTASMIEVMDMSNRMFFSANAKKGSQAWKPLVIPRPTAKPRKPDAPAKLLRAFGGGSVQYEKKGKGLFRRKKKGSE